MRDPKRIHGYCEQIEKYWTTVPDQRAGQFLSNLLSVYYGETHRDPFFPEDEEFFEVLDKAFSKEK